MTSAATLLLSRRWRRRRCWMSALSRKAKSRPRAWGVDEEYIFQSPSMGPSTSSSSTSAGFTLDTTGEAFFIDTEGSPEGASEVVAPTQPPKPKPKESPSLDEGAVTISSGAYMKASKKQRLDSELDVASAIPRGSMDFVVIPVTSSSTLSTETAVVEDEPVPELASLDRFYRESGNRKTEVQRRDAKAFFALQRYYFANGVGMNKAPDGSGEAHDEEAKRALRTDDGYLTKMGAKHFCVVCCGTGHRAHSCPETRCWICFNTGHNVKACPMANEKCSKCWRKGHSSENCLVEELKTAAKWWAQKEVRCVRCGKTGHANCRPVDEDTGKDDTDEVARSKRDADQNAQRVAAAVSGRRVILASEPPSDDTSWTGQARGGRGHARGGRGGLGRSDGRGKGGRGGRGEAWDSWKQKWHEESHGRGGRGRGRGRGYSESWEDQGSWNWHDGHGQQRKNSPNGLSENWQRFEASSSHDRSNVRDQLRAKLQQQQSRNGGHKRHGKKAGGGRSDNYGSVPASRIRDQPSKRAQRRSKNAKKEAKRRR